MLRLSGILVALLVLASAGIAEVLESRRRSDPEAAQQIQARMDGIPLTVGAWKGRTAEFNPLMLRQTNCVAHTFRVYTKDKSNDSFEMLLLAGDPGDIGTHDPERCYGGAGYKPVGNRRRVELTDPNSGQVMSYWSTRFDTETFPALSLQVIWAWTTDGAWSASDDARYEFMGRPILYKLYVTHRLPNGSESGTQTKLTDDFLNELLPEIRKALAAPSH